MKLLKHIFNPAAIVVATIVLLATFSASASAKNQPTGNNGTVKIHEASTEQEPTALKGNDPKVCSFHVHGFGFDNNQSDAWHIDQHAPTGNTANISSGNYTANTSGEWSTGAITIPEGHYKLFVDGAKSSDKQKTFWVECANVGGPLPQTPPYPDTCNATDLYGYLEYTGNHMSDYHVVGYFNNNADPLADCATDVYVHIFGSHHAQAEDDGWLESQAYIETKTFTIPAGSNNYKVEFDVPDAGYCWYQVDATRTSEVRVPPYYSGVDMIDYVFVQDQSSCGGHGGPVVTMTPTPTPTCTSTTCVIIDCPNQADCEVVIGTPTPTSFPSTPTPTPTNTPVGGSTPTTNTTTGSSQGSVLGATTLANTGNFANTLANLGIISGIGLIASAVFRKSKRA